MQRNISRGEAVELLNGPNPYSQEDPLVMWLTRGDLVLRSADGKNYVAISSVNGELKCSTWERES